MIYACIRNHVLFYGLIPVFALAVISTGCSCEDGPLGARQAVLEVNPDPIVFDVIATRNQAVKTVRIINTGAANLILEGDPLLEVYTDLETIPLKIDNVLTPIDCATGETRAGDAHVLRPGECRTIDLLFKPMETGTVEGMLVFKSNDDKDTAENHGRREVPIIAPASAPDIEVCLVISDCTDTVVCYDHDSEEALHIDFPLTEIGSSISCGILVSNNGELPLSSMSWGFTEGNRYQDFSLDPDDLDTLSIDHDSGVEFSIIFTPVAGGERSGKIILSSNDPWKNQIPIEVRGMGDGPKVCPDPMPLVDFGDVEIGDSKEKIVNLENCGTMPLEISDVWLQNATGSHTSEDYFLAPGTSPSATLQPGEELAVTIEFKPRSAERINGRLYFSSNDPIVPQAFVNLTGKGLIPPACELAPSTSNLSFGSAAVGHQPARRTLVVSNVGELPCHDVIGDITAGMAAEFRHVAPSADNQPYDIDPGEYAEFYLEYEPNDFPINHTGVFTITTPNMPHNVVVELSGTSTDQPTCNLSVTPRGSGFLLDECMAMGANTRLMQFGPTRTGQQKILQATLENVGAADCMIESTEIKSSMPFFPSSGFSFTNQRNRVLVNGVLTDTIRPGETGILNMTFAPAREEQSCGDLWIQTSDVDHPSECRQAFGFPPSVGRDGCYSIQLRGAGVRAHVAAVPSSVDFGLITIDCLSPERELSIYNTGGIDVNVTNITLSPDDGTFMLGGIPPLPATIAVGSRMVLGLTYAPTGNPTTHSGTITITSDAENSPTVVPLEGRSTHDTYQVDEFEQLSEPQVDVLWVIDDSCSMGDIQTNLRNNIHVFMQRALDQNTDFHMAVITTDWDDQNKAGRFQSSGNWPKIIDRNVSDPVQAFRDNANVGTSGHHIEKGFDCAYMALTDPLISGHNAGFLRDDAKLAIIFVSDEEEQSSASVDFFVDFFRNIKGHRNDALMSVHSIVGDHPGGCDNQHGSADPAPRYIEAANRTGGLFRSICAPDWGQVADDMGLDAFAARREFFLSREPIENTIIVQINGNNVPRTGNWNFDIATNSVIFSTSSIPSQGSSIRVSYEVLCRQ